MSVVAAAAAAGCLVWACLVSHNTGKEVGHAQGYESGVVAGRLEMLDSVGSEMSHIAAQAELKALSEREKSLLFAQQAERELAALGKDRDRAKRELAQHIKEQSEQSTSCTQDHAGRSAVDSDIVRMLNNARDETDLGSGRDKDSTATQGADDPTTAPAAVKWSDVAQGDLDAVQGYSALAAKHTKLIAWVNQFCTTNNKE